MQWCEDFNLHEKTFKKYIFSEAVKADGRNKLTSVHAQCPWETWERRAPPLLTPFENVLSPFYALIVLLESQHAKS